ncbi:pyruvate ferredoxin oxidoreductase [Clostridiaceae bacterium UIB06]|uniref:Pyruvate ferredoxin oxidoreductase n=1 Tax=Clostridium thailandense TaxID=2794346 RepID=A0A949TNG9_9CLOT|nr:transketolase C-terminal domain-containing protein [Clostridium thailandense]MBV7273677.1 pyruvate ferredoxin oxidoreductase [Clostridium thailandense]MCH5137069.1 pyruvate ferredoxin oxidoreductase [Clostridiaceae bacterium UIB06]
MAYKMLDGNGAAVEAIKMAKVKVVSAYPITPQSTIAEKLSEIVASGELKAEYVRVESEHTALSVATTAQLTGVRTATATASQGLALMHEVVGMTSGVRAPIVMPVVNRGLAAPWTLWCEHGDAMAERDMGWLQFYCQNVQEVYDIMLMAYRVAEDEKVLTPAMVCLDGFFLSHSMQKIDVPSQEEVDEFVGPYVPKNTYLDTSDPMFICNLTGSDDYTEMRYQQKVAMDNSFEVIEKVQKEFEEKFGRKLSIVEGYRTEDADVVLVALGSMCGTAKYVVNKLREQGKKVGLVKVVVFRPFPVKYLKEVLKGKEVIGVFDRSAGLGGQGGPVWSETCAAMKAVDCDIRHYVGGLGGRDVTADNIEKIFNELLEIKKGKRKDHTQWIDVKENAMDIRQVEKNARN